MEALRKVVKSDDISNFFDLPESFKKRKLEIIIIPLEDADKKVELKRPGAFEGYKLPNGAEQEKIAWEIAMREKHENS